MIKYVIINILFMLKFVIFSRSYIRRLFVKIFGNSDF